jgi:hypothetical protein
MKKTAIFYWVVTVLFAAFMLFSAVPDVIVTHEAVTFMQGNLHYPVYIISFLGVAKVLGVIAILVPGFPRIKEWAYAGLAFDLIGATYSIIWVNGVAAAAFMALPLLFGAASYLLYHRKQKGGSSVAVDDIASSLALTEP